MGSYLSSVSNNDKEKGSDNAGDPNAATKAEENNHLDKTSEERSDIESPPPESGPPSTEATPYFGLNQRSQSTYSVKDYIELHNEESVPWLVKEQPKSPKLLQAIKNAINTESKFVSSFATIGACLLTFALTNRGEFFNFNIAAFVVVLLVGSVFPTLATSVATGAYAGTMSQNVAPNYGWVTLLGVVVTLLWHLVVRFKLLLGFPGRLGCTAFVAANFTAAVTVLSGQTSSNVYGTSDRLWAQLVRWQPSVWLVACTTTSTMLAALFRLYSTNPLNPVIAATFPSLLLMLIVLVTEYEYANIIIQGLATGAFAGMASFDQLPTIVAFGATGVLAGLWALFLTPFFLGFGGKEGFVALLGYLTYALFFKALHFVYPEFGTTTYSKTGAGRAT